MGLVKAWTGAIALLVVACGGAVSHGAASVIGTTVDSATREPVGEVEVVGPGGARAHSDGAGRFRLEGLAPGETGEVVGRAPDGRVGRVALLPLGPGEREVVLFLGPPPGEGAGTGAEGD
jgi:hypothetical protein